MRYRYLCLLSMLALNACGRALGDRVSESSFAQLQTRGQAVMGVDQYASKHFFEDLPDGGRVVLDRDDPADTASIRTIRVHMRDIEGAFRLGNFTAPGLVHAREVPGTKVMTAKRSAITYAAVDRPRGAELRIRSSDSTAVRAIHDFLAFQRMDHRAAGHEGH